MDAKSLEDQIRNDYEVLGRYPELRICCPQCDETRFRFGINVQKKVGHCLNCIVTGKQIGRAHV